MIEAIGISEGVMLAMRDFRAADGRRRAIARRRPRHGDRQRIEIDDALAAIGIGDDPTPVAAADGGATVTAALVARRLVAAADRGIAMQARLGAAAVRRLVGSEM